jgi:hypothetical protein
MPHTINGSINSAVWLEYSTNGGTSYTRLPTSFPAGTSIVTDLLPIDVNLKIRLIAVCDESLVSNVADYKKYNAEGMITITNANASAIIEQFYLNGSWSVVSSVNDGTPGLKPGEIAYIPYNYDHLTQPVNVGVHVSDDSGELITPYRNVVFQNFDDYYATQCINTGGPENNQDAIFTTDLTGNPNIDFFIGGEGTRCTGT